MVTLPAINLHYLHANCYCYLEVLNEVLAMMILAIQKQVNFDLSIQFLLNLSQGTCFEQVPQTYSNEEHLMGSMMAIALLVNGN